MFSYLEGRVTERDLDCMTVDVGGVGFLVYASPQTISQADSDRCRIYTRVVFKENGMDIYGFLTKEEREMFDRLTAVSGVGPKTALGVLGALPVRQLALAVVTGDVKAIKSAPGIGPKTAQRLILELKDKISTDELIGGGYEAPAKGAAPVLPAASNAERDALEALEALGYSQGEAAGALARVKGQADTAEELIRLSLRAMNQA